MSGEVLIISSSAIGMAENIVCFVDADETVGSGGVVAVMVWVVAFGEAIELAANFSLSFHTTTEQVWNSNRQVNCNFC